MKSSTEKKNSLFKDSMYVLDVATCHGKIHVQRESCCISYHHFILRGVQ